MNILTFIELMSAVDNVTQARHAVATGNVTINGKKATLESDVGLTDVVVVKVNGKVFKFKGTEEIK